MSVDNRPSASAALDRNDAIDAERRQVTVMFVDLVGSSRLAELLDPEDFGELIVAYRRAASAIIEARNGFVARYLGDGILAYWGYPKAREHNTGRAVSAGLEIISAVEKLNRNLRITDISLCVRIGIDLGIVIVGNLGGSAAAGNADIVGDAPNTASRLQQLADPNTVLITETVRQFVEWQFEFVPCDVELKGSSMSTRVYRVLAERPPSQRTRSNHIYDREVEQGILDQRWGDVTVGNGRAILITGEPGIGKTVLVDHLRRTVTASGGMCLYSNCFVEGTSSPLFPIRALLQQAVGIALLDDIATLRQRIEAVVQRDGLDRGAVSEILLPLLDPSHPEIIEIYDGERKPRTVAFICNWLQTIAQRVPLSIIIEDIHWADSTSLEFLEMIMAEVSTIRVCFVLTRRTGFQTTLVNSPNLIQIDVMRLKDEAIEALVAEIAGDDQVAADVKHAIAARAEGNPLFGVELARLAISALADGRSADALALPASLNDSLVARLDDLGEVKPIAQVAAVLGREFDEQVLARVLDLPRAVLTHKLEALIAAGVIVDLGGGLQASHAFKHVLIREAAYSGLLRARRRLTHAKIARVLTSDFSQIAELHPELVAQHLEEADIFSDAIIWWVKAGEQASRQSTTVDSIRLFERARALFANLPDENKSLPRAELSNLLGVQYIAAHGYASPLASSSFSEAVSILESYGNPPSTPLFVALWGLHVHAMVRADMPRAIEIGVRMLNLAEKEGDPEKVLQANRLQGLSQLLTGAHREATYHYSEVLRRYNSAASESQRFRYGGDPGVLALIQLAWSEWIGGRILLSERHAAEAIGHARRIAHAHSLVYAIAVDSLRLLTGRDFISSKETAIEARTLAEKHGFRYWIAWSDIVLAGLERQADPDRAYDLLTKAIGRYQSTGARQLVPYALALEAECLLDLDRPRDAGSILDSALALVEDTGVRLYQAEILRLRACTAHRLGESNEETYLRASIQVARAQCAESFVLRSLLSAFEIEKNDQTREIARNALADLLLKMTDVKETADLRAARKCLWTTR
jgi:predicted ATPase/class 3 adenylate cyclase